MARSVKTPHGPMCPECGGNPSLHVGTQCDDLAEAREIAARLMKRSEARYRAWILAHAGMLELHTSDYPRRLEAMGLVTRHGSTTAIFHDHVITPTPLFRAVAEIWARDAAQRLSRGAIEALRTVKIAEDVEPSALRELEVETAIFPDRGGWRRSSFGLLIYNLRDTVKT